MFNDRTISLRSHLDAMKDGNKFKVLMYRVMLIPD